MINQEKINKTVSEVIKATESIINSMPEGTRLTTKEFVKQVVEETQIPVAIVTGITALTVNNCTSVKPRAGRNGGVYKVSGNITTRKNISAIASSIVSNMRSQDDEDDMKEDGDDE